VDVSSYTEFHSLLDQYVIQGRAPVSFNISEDVDSPSYDKILKELIASIKKTGRHDKIQHPRYHTPMPVVPCCTPEEMKNLYNAIGHFWMVIIGTECGVCPKAQGGNYWLRCTDFSQRLGLWQQFLISGNDEQLYLLPCLKTIVLLIFFSFWCLLLYFGLVFDFNAPCLCNLFLCVNALLLLE
jgi:hypothetical protein